MADLVVAARAERLREIARGDALGERDATCDRALHVAQDEVIEECDEQARRDRRDDRVAGRRRLDVDEVRHRQVGELRAGRYRLVDAGAMLEVERVNAGERGAGTVLVAALELAHHVRLHGGDELLRSIMLCAEQLLLEAERRVPGPVVDAGAVFTDESIDFLLRLGIGQRALDRLREHEPQFDQVHRRWQDVGYHILRDKGFVRAAMQPGLRPVALRHERETGKDADRAEQQDRESE